VTGILEEGVSYADASTFRGPYAIRSAVISVNLWEAYQGYNRAVALGNRMATQTTQYTRDIWKLFEELAPISCEALRQGIKRRGVWFSVRP